VDLKSKLGGSWVKPNADHLAKLREGVPAWNRWREENPLVMPNLNRADLSGLNLSKADFSNGFFIRARFNNAYLRRASFYGAELFGAELRAADLQGASLRGARLHSADLRDCKLQGADLYRVDFIGTQLAGANLARAMCRITAFTNVDLSAVVGLTDVRHGGPSPLDTATLLKSGLLPTTFLRGCGVADSVIEYAPALFNTPIQFHSCFISYSSRDEGFATRLHADLQNRGVRCWFAPEDLKIGQKIREALDEPIQLLDRLLLVLSANSIASSWVEKEVETAMERERVQGRLLLFPIRIDDEVMKISMGWAADIRRSRHIGDFTRWKEHDRYLKSFEHLVRDLRPDGQVKSRLTRHAADSGKAS
jgi:hypothetical protein